MIMKVTFFLWNNLKICLLKPIVGKQLFFYKKPIFSLEQMQTTLNFSFKLFPITNIL